MASKSWTIFKTIQGVTFTIDYQGSYAMESLEMTAVRLEGYGDDIMDFLSHNTMVTLMEAVYEEERK